MDVSIIDDGAALQLPQGVRLPALWLLDNVEGPETKDPRNGQRLIDVTHAPSDLKITAVSPEEAGLRVGLGERSSYFSWWTLKALGAVLQEASWTFRAGDLDKLPAISFHDFLSNPKAELAWLRGFETYGFGRFTDGPSESGALFRLIEQFGYVRETNYGRHFEVRSEPNPTNLAYTGLGLPPHTDNPYRDPVPTLQLLYCLENSATGGESQVVDGFAAAEALRAEDRTAFDLLTQVDVPFAFMGQSGVSLSAKRPLIEVDADGRLLAVCYNTRSMGRMAPSVDLDLGAFYAAYHRFGQLLNDKAFKVEFALQPGESFLVNNRRVLHARAGFKADGHRWLQGAYADIDSLSSRRRVLEVELA